MQIRKVRIEILIEEAIELNQIPLIKFDKMADVSY